MNTLTLTAVIWFHLLGFSFTQSGPPFEQQLAGNNAALEGRLLFTGEKSFLNGGPACISCHSLNDPTLPVSGGTLAIDISLFGALPADALQERLTEIPFPHMVLMKGAFKGREVTVEEADKVIAYLKEVSQVETAEVSHFPAGVTFLWVGLLGLFLIIDLILIYWHKRKGRPVNERIFQRQTQSV